MPDEDIKNQSIIQDIKSKKFFKDSLDWYTLEYGVAGYLRSLSILLFLASLSLVSLSAFTIYHMFPLSSPFILVKLLERQDDEFSVIKKLDAKGDVTTSAEDLLSNYLVEQYVKRYESYNYSDIESNITFIKNSSARSVYLEYQKNLYLNPMVSERSQKYQRNIEVLKSSFDDQDSGNRFVKKAVVTVAVTEIESGAITRTSTHIAILQFSLSNIKLALNKLVPFGFSVASYQIILSKNADK